MPSEPLLLSELKAGLRLKGIHPSQTVTLVAVEALSAEIFEVVYREENGTLGSRTLIEANMAGLSIVAADESAPPFDADPDEWRLAAEALRIKYAALYDPMVAVNSSSVEPLPHQIRAVYEELLPRIPLRYLLADDPGAGKTIMAGLYLKELMLRSDCERVIIVAPGGLVDQWRDELSQKFDLQFEIFNIQMVDDAQGRNVFSEHPYLIARMDQLSRNDNLMEQLEEVHWDVAVVDEAHRMSAHYSSWGGEIKYTARFRLGRLLSETAQNYLLMTATPHAGKEEDFQLFMSLLDRDRFEGKFRKGVHQTDTTGLMRRMVKEDLLTFEGKPLFPERRAYSVKYELSVNERDLYEQVTDYVRTEMGRADQISASGDRKRGNNVGFALTILQRRLASSPEAILRSLERRQRRLQDRLLEMQRARDTARFQQQSAVTSDVTTQWDFSIDDFEDLDEDVSETERERFEQQLDMVVDLATAAQTAEELGVEITILDDLILAARKVRAQDVDKKWVELRSILEDRVLQDDGTGSPRKIIIFTEHKDTLYYLQQRITTLFGRSDSLVTIHGGTKREDRQSAREQFSENPNTVILLATDAAGEGLNLQRAHLMVNYDLPWNPNRIEQRFGRIHRIGQREVCHLWNLVAEDTREGEVFSRLLEKIEQQGIAYNGNLFHVLGEQDAFNERPLKALLLEAIRYGDRPDIKAKLEQTIDASVAAGLDELLREKALHPEMFPALQLEEVREKMEQARERKLQPGYIRDFFLKAFSRLGGQVRKREAGRYEIIRVPTVVQEAARRLNRWAPVADKYERISFEIPKIFDSHQNQASLIAPGHPLLNAVIELTNKQLGQALERGAVLVDSRPEQLADLSLIYVVEQKITAPTSDLFGNHISTISHHFDYVHLAKNDATIVNAAPTYLDFERPQDSEIVGVEKILSEDWVRKNHVKDIRASAFRDGLIPRLDELTTRIGAESSRTKQQVQNRLRSEMNHWDTEHNRLELLERTGVVGKIRAETAFDRAREMERRLEQRIQELEQSTQLVPSPALITGVALVVPSMKLSMEQSDNVGLFSQETKHIERRAVDAVLTAERALGRFPEEMPFTNPGYDIRSTDSQGRVFYIEVKGRIDGADTFTITANEVLFAQTQVGRHVLALVKVHTAGDEFDEVRYISNAFNGVEVSDTTRSLNEAWGKYWQSGQIVDSLVGGESNSNKFD